MANIWRGVVVVIAFFVILGTIGLNLTPLLAGATVIGATLGFGAQSMVRDLLSGLLLIIEGQYDIGDTVMVGDTTGTVEDLTLRVTRLRGFDGTLWFVPNGEIRKLANSSRGWAQAAVDMPVPAVADVDVVLRTVMGAAESVVRDPRYAPFCLEPPTAWGVVSAAADTFTTRVSVRTTIPERDRVRRALLEEITRRLHAAHVFVPLSPAPSPDSEGSAQPRDDG
jgi:small conductance mechanosensitive channel